MQEGPWHIPRDKVAFTTGSFCTFTPPLQNGRHGVSLLVTFGLWMLGLRSADMRQHLLLLLLRLLLLGQGILASEPDLALQDAHQHSDLAPQLCMLPQHHAALQHTYSQPQASL